MARRATANKKKEYKMNHHSYEDCPEDEYWYNLGWDVGYKGLEDIGDTVNPAYLKDYEDGVEDGEYAYEVEFDDEEVDIYY